jgi:hypothetical protein
MALVYISLWFLYALWITETICKDVKDSFISRLKSVWINNIHSKWKSIFISVSVIQKVCIHDTKLRDVVWDVCTGSMTVRCWMVGWVIDDGLERVRKVLSQNLPGRIDENMKTSVSTAGVFQLKSKPSNSWITSIPTCLVCHCYTKQYATEISVNNYSTLF